MCVSAEASFSLGGTLVPIGLYCLRIARQRDLCGLPIAAVPLFFGVQQICEGLVWVGVNRGDDRLTRPAAIVFLFFALAFWLFWIPFSAVFLEERRKRKIPLGIDALIGVAAGALLFLPIVIDPAALRVTVIHHSLSYNYADSPDMMLLPQPVWQLVYLAIIALPLVLLKSKDAIFYSTALVLTATLSHVVFLYAFASIWCFASAILSLFLGYVFYKWPLPETQQH
ncbi:MAG TPA: DUF6629 family protein [Pirellulales bacterium]|nr:DUF6629 family protein [Pirellulales bacterium]